MLGCFDCMHCGLISWFVDACISIKPLSSNHSTAGHLHRCLDLLPDTRAVFPTVPRHLQVGALRKLRGEMLVICSNITTQIMEELQDRVYSHAGASSSNSYSSSMLEAARVGTSATAAAAAAAAAVLQEEGLSYHRTASLHNASPSAAGRRPASAVMGRVASAPALHRRAASSMPAFLVEALAESQGQSGPGRLASMHDLVACLLQLDALDEAKAFINLHTRRETRKLMLAAVEQWVQAMLQRGTPTNLAGEQRHMHSASCVDGLVGMCLCLPAFVQVVSGLWPLTVHGSFPNPMPHHDHPAQATLH